MENNTEDDVIETGFEKTSEKLSLKQIVFVHIKELAKLSREDMREGFMEQKPVKMGDGTTTVTSVWHDDKRKGFINGVDFLLDLIIKDADKDADEDYDFKKIADNLEKKLDELFKKAIENEDIDSDWIDTKLSVKKKLFREIMLFLEKINFFGSGEDYGE